MSQVTFDQPGDAVEGFLLGSQPGKPAVAFVSHAGGVSVVRLTPSLFHVVRSLPEGSRIQIRFTHEEVQPNGTRQKRFAVETPTTSTTNPVHRTEKDKPCQPAKRTPQQS